MQKKLLISVKDEPVGIMLSELLSPFFSIELISGPLGNLLNPVDAVLIDAPQLSELEALHPHCPEALMVALLNADQVRAYELLPYIKVIEKPFRVATLLDVFAEPVANVYDLGPFIFYPSHRFLRRQHDQATIPLTEKETEMLEFLYRNAGNPQKRQDILEKVWGYSSLMTTHTLETHIYRLRKKLEIEDAPDILASHALGYVLELPGR